jgi:hypothetical protein
MRDELDLLRNAVDSHDATDWHPYVRAELRLELALKLSAFREKHGYHKPMPVDAKTEDSEPAKVAS